ncbi:Hypothetical predicted protein [Lecanosticta acicola]|uniref:Uncharacterized protein n=1 Tax=Lecanosticta acicola TaxID=111012 RepID=A0AAI8Z3I5_9PEZI|nr:Hypothetical predicted protein [Lecanosticta acicola]
MKYALLFNAFTAVCVAKGQPKLCGSDKHNSIQQAIGKFCQKTNIVVPSTYATNGMRGNDGKGFVSIEGTCHPPQWVPQEYCMEQFNNMCANEEVTKKFGRNGCQTWITYGPA